MLIAYILLLAKNAYHAYKLDIQSRDGRVLYALYPLLEREIQRH